MCPFSYPDRRAAHHREAPSRRAEDLGRARGGPSTRVPTATGSGTPGYPDSTPPCPAGTLGLTPPATGWSGCPPGTSPIVSDPVSDLGKHLSLWLDLPET